MAFVVLVVGLIFLHAADDLAINQGVVESLTRRRRWSCPFCRWLPRLQDVYVALSSYYLAFLTCYLMADNHLRLLGSAALRACLVQVDPGRRQLLAALVVKFHLPGAIFIDKAGVGLPLITVQVGRLPARLRPRRSPNLSDGEQFPPERSDGEPAEVGRILQPGRGHLETQVEHLFARFFQRLFGLSRLI